MFACALFSLSTASALAYKGFTSPSGNIGCAMTTAGVRCDIDEHSWPTPPKPKSCSLDYGNGLSLSKHGRPKFNCAGDTTLGIGPPLSYGDAVRKGRFLCVSEEVGVRCVNRRNSHGFLLSREIVRRF